MRKARLAGGILLCLLGISMMFAGLTLWIGFLAVMAGLLITLESFRDY